MLHLFQVLTLLTLNIHLFDGQDLKSHDLRSIKNQRFAGVQWNYCSETFCQTYRKAPALETFFGKVAVPVKIYEIL